MIFICKVLLYKKASSMAKIIQRVYLWGFMGSGKTYLAQRLAQAWGWRWLDLDQWIEQQMQMPIATIFATYGEAYFRQLETQALHTLATEKRLIIATGGGAPCFNNNHVLMNTQAQTLTLFLNPPLYVIYERLQHQTHTRPLLANKTPSQIWQTIYNLYLQRYPIYTQAHAEWDSSLPIKYLEHYLADKKRIIRR